MDPFSHGRVHARVTLDADFRVTFLHEGRVFSGLPMATLSTGGFGLRLPAAVTEGMEAGQPLAQVRFDHPDLPRDPVQGEITHLLAQRHGNHEAFVLVGVKFVDPSPAFQAEVNAFVAERLVV